MAVLSLHRMKHLVDEEALAFLARRPLTTDEEDAFAAIDAAWANSLDLQAAFFAAPEIVRKHFINIRLRIADHAKDHSDFDPETTKGTV